MIEIVPVIVDHEFACNCYLIFQQGHALIIDPGTKNHRIADEIEKRHAQVDGIVLTHGHFDHIAGVDRLVKRYHCPLYLHEADMAMLRDPYLNYSIAANPLTVQAKAEKLGAGEQQVGTFHITVIDAPGHSEGSVMILIEDHLFSGDALFQMGIGRTDLPGGSNSKMIQTLRMIKTLQPVWHVYPGHGPFTTIEQELLYNPYLAQV